MRIPVEQVEQDFFLIFHRASPSERNCALLRSMGRSKAKSWSNAPKAAQPSKKRRPAATVNDDYDLSDEEQEEDAFEARRDKINIKGSKIEDDEDDDEQDEEVLGLDDDEEDDEDEDEDDGEDDAVDDDDDEAALIERAIARGGRSAEREWTVCVRCCSHANRLTLCPAAALPQLRNRPRRSGPSSSCSRRRTRTGRRTARRATRSAGGPTSGGTTTPTLPEWRCVERAFGLF